MAAGNPAGVFTACVDIAPSPDGATIYALTYRYDASEPGLIFKSMPRIVTYSYPSFTVISDQVPMGFPPSNAVQGNVPCRMVALNGASAGKLLLYINRYNAGTFTGQFWEYDPVTGVATLIVDALPGSTWSRFATDLVSWGAPNAAGNCLVVVGARQEIWALALPPGTCSSEFFPPPCDLPSAPLVAADPSCTNQAAQRAAVALTWPPSTGNPPVTYDVARQVSGETAPTVLVQGITDTMYLATDLAAGTAVTFTVIARNACGAAVSAPVTITPTCPPPAPPPGHLAGIVLDALPICPPCEIEEEPTVPEPCTTAWRKSC
jgi:hypothetical protein